MGMIQMVSGPHLIVITGRKPVGSILGKFIWCVTDVKILPCATDAIIEQLSDGQLDDEERFVELVKHFIAVTGIYYSAEYDLTRPFQQHLGQVLDLGKVDPRFFLNRFIAEPFLRAFALGPASMVDHFVMVCIEGFVEIQPTSIHQKGISFGLVSRRATGRVGTRHFSRGIDDYGNVSNFVETEQIVLSGKHAGAFVQVRGSIPIYWRQNTNLRYKPPMELYNEADNGKVFRAHFTDLIARTGQVVAVNLVDRSGWEGILAKQYAMHVDDWKHPALKYVHFDFHQHCRKMQWHKISLLMDSIDADLRAQGHLTMSLQEGGSVLCRQQGIVRTNCIDCLDRTNVVQSVIGQRMLNEQLQEMGLFKPGETIAVHADLLWFFKNIWADNGDAISQQYAGTGALKSDFTRTGKRTIWGAAQDGLKSIIRYHKSNFTDGQRQDAMDLFHGRYMVSASGPSPFKTSIAANVSPTSILLAALAMCYATAWLLSRSGLGQWIPGFLHLPLILAPSIVMIVAILQNGTFFVRYPQLVPAHVGFRVKAAGASPTRQNGLSLFSRKVHQI